MRRLPKIVERPLMRHSADGLATHVYYTEPNETPPDEPMIEIDSRLTGRVRLETILHEALHLALPWLMEPVVLKVARYLAMIVWHLEYRSKNDR